VEHTHGLATGGGHDLGMIFGEHGGEPAAGLGGEREGGRSGPLGRGVCGRHGALLRHRAALAARTEAPARCLSTERGTPGAGTTRPPS